MLSGSTMSNRYWYGLDTIYEFTSRIKSWWCNQSSTFENKCRLVEIGLSREGSDDDWATVDPILNFRPAAVNNFIISDRTTWGHLTSLNGHNANDVCIQQKCRLFVVVHLLMFGDRSRLLGLHMCVEGAANDRWKERRKL